MVARHREKESFESAKIEAIEQLLRTSI